MSKGTSQLILSPRGFEEQERAMHPDLNIAIVSAREQEIRQFVVEQRRVASAVARSRGAASRFAFWRYFGHADEADQQPVRRPDRRADGTGIGARAGG
jgi:hypothetical protein